MEKIYCYTSYRDFLRDSYAEAKSTNPAFSYRYFARKAGFSSPNFLKLVIDGKRNLTQDSTQRFAKVFKLRLRERKFFELLVQFNQSNNPEEQSYYYEQLLSFPEYAKAHQLAEAEYEYLTNWFNPVIQDLANLEDFNESPVWIASRLRGSIKEAQAVEALKVLQRLGLLERDENNFLKQTHAQLTTGEVAQTGAAHTYHKQMLERAVLALNDPADSREFGAVTVGINKEQLVMLKNAIRDFRKVVMNLAENGKSKPTAVYQLNIQLFGHTNFEESQ